LYRIKLIYIMKNLLKSTLLAFVLLFSLSSIASTEEINPIKFYNSYKESVKGDDELEQAKKAIQEIRETGINTNAKVTIVCHTPYAEPFGNSCVNVNGIMVEVEWQTGAVAGHVMLYTFYSSHLNSNCRC